MKLKLNIKGMKLKLDIIDYIWYTGERFHQEKKSPGDGNLLIAICWYCTFFLPLSSLLNKLRISSIIQILGSIVLIIIPFVFCRIRYKKKKKELIELQYKNKKKWGKRLLTIWSILIIVVIVEFVFLIKTGFWHLGA